MGRVTANSPCQFCSGGLENAAREEMNNAGEFRKFGREDQKGRGRLGTRCRPKGRRWRLGTRCLPESLQELESVVVWVLFMLKQWEITSTNVNDARKLLSWQHAVEAVSEALDPDREADGKCRSGYSPRSIANTLEYFMSKAPAR